MNRLFILSVIIVFVTAGTARPAETGMPGSITISAESAVVKSGEAIHLDITIANLSHQGIAVIPFPDKRGIRVWHDDGRPVLRKEPPDDGHAKYESVFGSGLDPGETSTGGRDIVANTDFDMREPGKYFIQLWIGLDTVDVPSNRIEVTVTK
jgi:hypothetical protein